MLYSLKVIDNECNLTEEYGLKISELPVETRIAVCIVNSFKEEFTCTEEMLILAALLSSQGNLFYNNLEPGIIIKMKKKLGAKEGDHITLINIFLRYQ